ncbi:MAG: DUF2846 domain-containing protein [Betaproteobacteria bacterium]|nr:DUF2846 domain-containing protein [Betaproteobacteria bacterium]
MWRVLLLAIALAGCASTPQASRGRDAEAKQFLTHPGSAAIYVYRADFPATNSDDSVLYVGDRLTGATLPGTYFRLDLRPGTHVLRGYGYDQGTFKLDVQSGALYFISLNVLGGNSHFRRVGPEAGKRMIQACCALLENWAPGQRPLLR